MRQQSHLTWRNIEVITGLLVFMGLLSHDVAAQMYYPEDYYRDQYYQEYYNNTPQQAVPQAPPQAPRQRTRAQRQVPRQSASQLQYDQRDAERILQDQMDRARQYPQVPAQEPQQTMYDNYYGHRINDEGQVRQVMAEARYIGDCIRNRNGKPMIVIDKRNFQFYLYDRDARLLRIGPVAIGKGKTEVGGFETPVGVFPIRSKHAVDDWVRPDWYFIEEGEPIPKKWEDRRVPGFFRYKMVFDGSRYIHYAEATGGRLTHGCLGLDWQDAEAVFHTLEKGSYCIVADQGFFNRLARGEFPVQKQAVAAKPKKPETATATVTAQADEDRSQISTSDLSRAAIPERAFRDLW
jgi:lipoprotein-anchoring transpeptidase ErfK/SrfK